MAHRPRPAQLPLHYTEFLARVGRFLLIPDKVLLLEVVCVRFFVNFFVQNVRKSDGYCQEKTIVRGAVGEWCPY